MSQAIPTATESNWREAANRVMADPSKYLVEAATVIEACEKIRSERIGRAVPWTMVLPDGLTVRQEHEFARAYEDFVAGGEVEFPATTAHQYVLSTDAHAVTPQIILSDSRYAGEQDVTLPKVG